MATAIQRRRGNTSQHASFTGLAGELTIDTDLNTIIVHDGTTPGGIRLAKYSEVESASEGDITAVTTAAGSGLLGGNTTGAVDLALDYENLQGNLIPSANNVYSLGSLTNVWKDVYVGPGSLYVNGQKVLEDNSGTIQFSADTNQNISILTTGVGDVELTSGGSIQLKSDVTLSAGKTFTQIGGFTLASNINMNSNNINNLDNPVGAQDAATKSYVDALNTDDISEGTNLYFTDQKARDAISVTDAGGDGSLSYSSATGIITYTGPSATQIRAHFSAGGDLSFDSATGVISFTERTERTDAEVRGLVSVTDAGGDGSLSYSSATGIITYTGPSASEVRAHFSAGDGVTISNGSVAVDGTVVRTTGTQSIAGAKTFSNDIVVSGNLTVSGTTTTVNSETINLADNIIELNSNAAGLPTENSGLTVNRGSSADVSILWDETLDKWTFTNDGAAYQAMLTDASARALLSAGGDLSYNSTTGAFSFTERSDSAVRGLISVSDAGGDGSLSYSSATGIITYTGPSAAQVRAHISASGDLAYNATTGVISYTEPTMYADADARAAISASGDLAYNSTTGVISFTERTDAEVRGLVSATGDLAYNATTGAFSFTERTDAEVRGLVSATGDLAYNATTGAFSFTERTDAEILGLLSGGTGITYNSATGAISLTDTGYVTGVTAGTGLTGGGTDGTVTLNVSGLTVTEFAGAAIQTGLEAFVDSDTVLMTAAAVQDKILSYGYTTTVGDITGVTAGTGLSGGGASGAVTVNLADTTVAPASYGTASSVASFTVDAQGRLTAAAVTPISIAATQISSGTLASARLPDLVVGDFAAAAIQLGSEVWADSDTVLMTAAAVNDLILSKGYITSQTDGQTLSWDGATGVISISGGNSVDLDGRYVTTTSAQALGAATNVLTASGSTITLARGDGTTDVVTVPDTNTTYAAGTDLTLAGTTFNVTSATAATANTIAKRDASGNLTANVFSGTSTAARYADLAEKYATDADYEPGTVVCFGGEAEVTACAHAAHHAVAGVISTDPAYMMNSDAQGQYVALTGRVPCKVTGPVAKGDLIVSSEVVGHGKADNNAQAGRIIGKAIGSSEGGETVIEVLVNMM